MPRYLLSSGTADVGVVAHAIGLMVARGAGEVCVVDGLAQLVLDNKSVSICAVLSNYILPSPHQQAIVLNISS